MLPRGRAGERRRGPLGLACERAAPPARRRSGGEPVPPLAVATPAAGCCQGVEPDLRRHAAAGGPGVPPRRGARRAGADGAVSAPLAADPDDPHRPRVRMPSQHPDRTGPARGCSRPTAVEPLRAARVRQRRPGSGPDPRRRGDAAPAPAARRSGATARGRAASQPRGSGPSSTERPVPRRLPSRTEPGGRTTTRARRAAVAAALEPIGRVVARRPQRGADPSPREPTRGACARVRRRPAATVRPGPAAAGAAVVGHGIPRQGGDRARPWSAGRHQRARRPRPGCVAAGDPSRGNPGTTRDADIAVACRRQRSGRSAAETPLGVRPSRPAAMPEPSTEPKGACAGGTCASSLAGRTRTSRSPCRA